MKKHTCTSKEDIIVIEGKEYTVEYLLKTVKNYDGVLKRANKYSKKIRQKAKADLLENKKAPTAANS